MGRIRVRRFRRAQTQNCEPQHLKPLGFAVLGLGESKTTNPNHSSAESSNPSHGGDILSPPSLVPYLSFLATPSGPWRPKAAPGHETLVFVFSWTPFEAGANLYFKGLAPQILHCFKNRCASSKISNSAGRLAPIRAGVRRFACDKCWGSQFWPWEGFGVRGAKLFGGPKRPLAAQGGPGPRNARFCVLWDAF